MLVLASDRQVWRNLTDGFPHPYTAEAYRRWLDFVASERGRYSLAVEIEGRLAGGIALLERDDIYRFSVILAYWLARPHWGRGIMTAAVRTLCVWAWAHGPWVRIQADILGWNSASGRVLEKVGFVVEGRRPRAIFKDGEFTDEILYALYRPAEPVTPAN
jgi:ribosomal-protein-alanine N-acetyltransferase